MINLSAFAAISALLPIEVVGTKEPSSKISATSKTPKLILNCPSKICSALSLKC